MELIAAGCCEGQNSEWKFKNSWWIYQSVATETLGLEAPFSFRSPQLLATAEDGFWESLGKGREGLHGLHRPTTLFLPPFPTELHGANCSSACTFARIPGAAEVGTKVQL